MLTHNEVKYLEKDIPHDLLGLDVDNGSEALTFHLCRYLRERSRLIPLTRSRPLPQK